MPQFLLRQNPAVCRCGSLLTQEDKRVQPQGARSQSWLGAKPGGGFCFDCRPLDWPFSPCVFPFLGCHDLGASEPCWAPCLSPCTPVSVQYEAAPREAFSLIYHPHRARPASSWLWGTWLWASLNEGISVGFFSSPLSSCLPLHQGLQSDGHPQEADRNAGSLWKWEFGLQS